MAKKDPRFPYRADPLIGTRKKHWVIVNAMSGCVAYFDGNEEAANAEAERLETEHRAWQRPTTG